MFDTPNCQSANQNLISNRSVHMSRTGELKSKWYTDAEKHNLAIEYRTNAQLTKMLKLEEEAPKINKNCKNPICVIKEHNNNGLTSPGIYNSKLVEIINNILIMDPHANLSDSSKEKYVEIMNSQNSQGINCHSCSNVNISQKEKNLQFKNTNPLLYMVNYHSHLRILRRFPLCHLYLKGYTSGTIWILTQLMLAFQKEK